MNERDLSVKMKKREINEEINLYPESKAENILIDSSGATLKKFIEDQKNKNLEMKNIKDKLDGISEGAEKNQNAFSKITIENKEITASLPADEITVIAGKNVTFTCIGKILRVDVASSGSSVSSSEIEDIKNRLDALENKPHDVDYGADFTTNSIELQTTDNPIIYVETLEEVE